MKILGIDTTRKKAIVFVLDTKDLSQKVVLEMGEDIKHSEGLFLYVEQAIEKSKIDLSEVDAFACVVGPGSFTGIRVGMSTIKGLKVVGNKPVISLNVFESMKDIAKDSLIVLNSTSTACYYALVKNNKISKAGVVEKFNISSVANGLPVLCLKEEQDLISSEYNNIRPVDNIAELIIKCVVDKLNNGDYGEFLPYYLQLSQAERSLK
ncbi:MAG: tRNA (adenosine(37)-N6)-threonylcarbamoyltransferase complex dimerization subunit type 1 TsaB [Clostridia bacterium]|nr:tRNA (adenosine(37)-N6)-threonylcarbamoyltransferase complex dimerization subunit type 1 TsaB [Clostridia bacterium]